MANVRRNDVTGTSDPEAKRWRWLAVGAAAIGGMSTLNAACMVEETTAVPVYGLPCIPDDGCIYSFDSGRDAHARADVTIGDATSDVKMVDADGAADATETSSDASTATDALNGAADAKAD